MELQDGISLELYSALVDAISHELRTPLTSITGAIEALSNHGSVLGDDAQRELMQIALGETRRLNDLIENLLVKARLDAGILRPRKECQSVPVIIDTALASFHHPAEKSQIALHIQHNLPLIEVDGLLIERVVISLLQYSLKRTPERVIDLHVVPTIDEVIFEVSDQGDGFPPGDEALLFSDFYPLQNGTSDELGIPHSLSRKIIEVHDGRIWAKNRAEGGVSVFFALPQTKNCFKANPVQ